MSLEGGQFLYGIWDAIEAQKGNVRRQHEKLPIINENGDRIGQSLMTRR